MRVGTGKEGRKAADKAALKLRAAFASGDVGVLEGPAAPARVVTFAAYAATWLAESVAPHRKERTAGYYRQIIDNHLTAAFGALPVAEIKPAHVRAFVAQKLNGQACV